MKALFIIGVGFIIGWAVIGKKIVQPNTDPLVNPPSNGYGAPVVDYTDDGVANGGT
jgi:hypothetical protein